MCVLINVLHGYIRNNKKAQKMNQVKIKKKLWGNLIIFSNSFQQFLQEYYYFVNGS